MGALDWLQDLIGGGGSGGGGMPMPPMQGLDDRPSTPFPQGGDPMGGMGTPPLPPGTDPMTAGLKPPTPDPLATQPMPPVQGLDRPPPAPFPPGGDPMAGTGSGNNGGLPPQPPVPMPAPRPPGANGPGLPPNMPVPPAGRPAAPPPNLPPPTPPLPPAVIAAQPPAPDSGPQAQSIIGRALGLDPNRERGMFGSLAGGLTAAGNSQGKGKGQALFSGAGGALEGGNKADKEIKDEQDRFLQRKLAANTQANVSANSASTRDLNVARTTLALAQAKQAMAGGKEGVANSDQQLYLRGLKAVHDATASSAATLKAVQSQFGTDSKEAKAAQKQHEDNIATAKKQVLGTLGVTEKEWDKIGKQPGMTADNPIDPNKGKFDQKKLDALPPGTHVVGPDGKVLVKKAPPAPAAGGNQPATAQQQMTPSVPPTPPTPVTAPAGSLADDED